MCHQLKSLIGLHTSTSPSTKTDIGNIVSSVSHLVTEQLKVKQELNRSQAEVLQVHIINSVHIGSVFFF